MSAASTTSRLAEIAQEQWGLITRAQAEETGISPATIARLSANGPLERVAHGVYHLSGAPTPDHLDLRAAWLQLAPTIPAWDRKVGQGVVSHRSAADLYGLGELAADRHEFIVATRRQSRRPDVRLHRRDIKDEDTRIVRGLPVTRPSRIAADLLREHEDPSAIALVIAESIRRLLEYPHAFASALAPHAAAYGLRRGDGVALLSWLLEPVGDPAVGRWIADARAGLTTASDNSLGALPPSPSSADRIAT